LELHFIASFQGEYLLFDVKNGQLTKHKSEVRKSTSKRSRSKIQVSRSGSNNTSNSSTQEQEQEQEQGALQEAQRSSSST
jgi:hypothetical protein